MVRKGMPSLSQLFLLEIPMATLSTPRMESKLFILIGKTASVLTSGQPK